MSGSMKKDATKDEEEFKFAIPPLDMEIITEILLGETDFLLDEKTREKVTELRPYEDDPEEVRGEKEELARKIKLETLKKTLELDSLEQMNSLYEDLYNHIRVLRKETKIIRDNEEDEEGAEAEEAEEAEEFDDEDGEIEYDPDAVIDALTRFMEKRQGRKEDQPEGSSPSRKVAKNVERERRESDLVNKKLLWEQ